MYNFSYQGFNMQTGHFTQVVWAGTTHVGLSLSDCGNFIFANYFPAGNMQNQFQQNVFPQNTRPIESSSSEEDDESEEDEINEEKSSQEDEENDESTEVTSMTSELKEVGKIS